MKIALINMTTSGSTGKIMLKTASVARKAGHEVKTFSTHTFSKKHKRLPPAPIGHEYYGCYLDNTVHYLLSSLFGKNGTHSSFSTEDLIRRLKKFKPDVIHIHNLHKYCINFSRLTDYLKKSGAKVVVTLHDCWMFTGHCPYFDSVDCDKWVTGCHDCAQTNSYPRERRDTSAYMYGKKKAWFSDFSDMTLAVPSIWLADQVKKSFLKNYPVKVINNGIDLSVFKRTDSDFKEKYGLSDKHIVLGVADFWDERKGLDVFLELAKNLDEKYKVVLVGVDDKTKKTLPTEILCIGRTENQTELAKIYTASDVLINASREDNFPTVNIEALACGTPVITFKTGGSPEILDDKCGVIIEKGDIDGLTGAACRICTEKPFSAEACVKRAERFDANKKFCEYVKLYEEKNK